MKNSIYLLAGVLLFFACKKESNNSTPNTATNSTNTITCIDNPNINFTSIGTPIGKFGECIKDIDGNVYKTVTIGSQTWMAENLKVSKYNDGTPIPNITDSLEWTKLTTGAWCNYNNNVSYNSKFGKLYNWYTVSPITNGNKNVCPTGWHVPNNIEWDQLIKLLGGDTIAGAKLKEIGSNNWPIPNEKTTNISLFTAIPSGGFKSGFKYLNKGALFWSSDENSNYDWLAWNASVGYNGTYVDFDDEPKTMGASIRCIKD
jgi:uncharacterized protein (TIGR02145 family)